MRSLKFEVWSIREKIYHMSDNSNNEQSGDNESSSYKEVNEESKDNSKLYQLLLFQLMYIINTLFTNKVN